ncbi:MAG: dockerin type I repeat-containing protein [Oscillospiraceae bacterium]|nr:dockerin type I repeat-containing protein [Oscillospiraceae bacterium]
MKKKILGVLLTVCLLLSMMTPSAFAAGDNNQVPVLKSGVAAAATAQAQVSTAYLLTDLQKGNIFTDPDGDKLTWASYSYERSTDGGATWGDRISFSEAIFGWTSLSLTETAAGTYLYRFYANDGTADSTDTWTLTLNVVEQGIWNTTFHVGQDMNYAANGNVYPIIRLYQTAGVDTDGDGQDYIGWFVVDGKAKYVFDAADYAITADETSSTGYYVAYENKQYELIDYKPVTFTDSTFGVDPTTGVPSGTLQSQENNFFASIASGAYSYRAYGYDAETKDYTVRLGGMSVTIPTDSNVDGGLGGGTDLYLRLQGVGTKTLKSGTAGDYFDADSFDTKVSCPIMNCTATSGTAYKSGSYTYYAYMLYAAGNACLYNYYAFTDDDYTFAEGYTDWSFGTATNRTVTAGYTSAGNYNVTLNQAVDLSVTAPAAADVGIFFQWNNFNTTEQPYETRTENADGTVTYLYKVQKSGGNWTWRASMDGYATKAGWLNGLSSASTLDITFGAGDETNPTTHSFAGLGTTVSRRDEADMMVNVDPSGFHTVSLGESFRVRFFRLWQIIDSDAGNIMIEPDFNYSVLSGNASITAQDGGNSTNHWLDVDPTGTVILAANYDAIDVDETTNSTHGGLYPATNPERTTVFVLSDTAAGTADANLAYNKSTSAATSRSADWDYNYDTWYYSATDTAPTLDFTVTSTGDAAVRYAYVTTDAALQSILSDWSTATADETGGYSIDLTPFRTAGTAGGTVILETTDSTGVSYRTVRVAECKITVTNASNPGEDIMPGNSVTLSFDGLYRGIHKISGIFNPTTFYLRYSAGDTEYNGVLGQYYQMDRTTISLTVPEDIAFADGADTTTYDFTNGYIFGSMYAAANPFAYIYAMTDSGVGTNFNAVTVNVMFSKLADAALEVHKTVTYDVKLDVTDGKDALSGCTIEVKDPDGNVVTPDETGIYQDLTYGTYQYTATKAGYVKLTDSFYLGAATADEMDKDTGLVTKTLVLTAAAAGAWDGATKAEPSQVSGVYQIGTGAELAWFASAVNGGQSAISGVLTADIDLAGYEWTPIGSSSKAFAGSFDGAGHRVYNLAIHYAADTTTAPYLGLFGSVKGASDTSRATLQNLTVEGAITATSTKSVSSAYLGGVAGNAVYANLTGCVNKVNVTVNRVLGNWQYVGGVTGYASSAALTGCRNEGSLSGFNYLGGVTGYASGATVLTDCGNSGSISGGSYVGGVASYLTGGSQLIRCNNTGAVTASADFVGGLAGYLNSSGSTVTGSNDIGSSYNTGSVTGGSYVGGLAGYVTASANANQQTRVEGSYNAGAVSGTGNTGSAIGSVMSASAVVKNLFCLAGSAANPIGSDAGGHTAAILTDAELKDTAYTERSVLTLLGIEFQADSANRNGGYPTLRWQTGSAAPTLESMTILTPPDKTAYIAAEVFDPTGMVVMGEYTDGVRALLTDYSCPTEALEKGATSVTITSGTVTAQVPITVAGPALTKVEITAQPCNTLYASDEEFDPTGMAVKATYQDGSTGTVAKKTAENEDGYTCALDHETGIVTVSYTGNGVTQETTLTVTALNSAAPKAVEGVYQLGSANDLRWFANQVNCAGNGGIDAVLTADIDLTGLTWTPIGSEQAPYAGCFDGGGYTIRGVTVRYTATSDTALYQGLFGCVIGTAENRAAIRNLTAEGTVTIGTNLSIQAACSGGVCGYAEYAELSSIVNRICVDKTADSLTGGLAGIGGVLGEASNVTVVNCGNEAAVTGVGDLGGVVGNAYDATVIAGCSNTGDITGEIIQSGDSGSVAPEKIGGIVGYLSDEAVVENCEQTGAVLGNKAVGGIVGCADCTAQIRNSFSTGTVTGSLFDGAFPSTGAIGAVIGQIGKDTVTVENVYFLTGTADAAIGTDTGSHTATAMTAEQIEHHDFVRTLNANAGSTVFCAGDKSPVLAWQGGKAVGPVDYGDLTGDGKIKVTDVLNVYAYLNGSAEFTTVQKQSADVNGDGKVNAADALLIYRYLNGAITEFPVEVK